MSTIIINFPASTDVLPDSRREPLHSHHELHDAIQELLRRIQDQIAGFSLEGVEFQSNKNIAGGYAGLELDGKVLGTVQRYGVGGNTALEGSQKAAASGVASLNASSLVVQNPANATPSPSGSKIPLSEPGGTIVPEWLPIGASRVGNVSVGASEFRLAQIEHGDSNPLEINLLESGIYLVMVDVMVIWVNTDRLNTNALNLLINSNNVYSAPWGLANISPDAGDHFTQVISFAVVINDPGSFKIESESGTIDTVNWRIVLYRAIVL